MSAAQLIHEYWQTVLAVLAALYFVFQFYDSTRSHIADEEPKVEQLSEIAEKTADSIERLAEHTTQQIKLNQRTEKILRKTQQASRDQLIRNQALCAAGQLPAAYCAQIQPPDVAAGPEE